MDLCHSDLCCSRVTCTSLNNSALCTIIELESNFLVDRMIQFVDIKIKDAFFREVSWLRDPESRAQEQMLGFKSWSYHSLAE